MLQIYPFWRKQEGPKPVCPGGDQMGELVMFWLSSTYSVMADKSSPQLTVKFTLKSDVVRDSRMKATIINGLY